MAARIGLGLLVLVAGVWMCTFRVYEYETAILFRLGEIQRSDYKPGLHFLVPIWQNVRKFDRRLQTLDAEPQRFLTGEKKDVIVDSFARWRIEDVEQFYKSTDGDPRRAGLLLYQKINDSLRGEFGKRKVQEVVSGERGVIMDVVTRTADRVGFGDWHALTRLHRPALKDPVFTPHTLWGPDDADKVFEHIADQDYLVHHPFDSFTSVETFLKAAVTDPSVIAIKITLYRIGANSPLIDLLIEAADEGKQVAVLVELKARFDERNNIAWATRLESAGIHVVYGLVNLKVHCKLCLVVRKEADGIRRYAHVATGNYNRHTSQVYTDLGLFTADEGLLDDVSEVFNSLTGYSSKRSYRGLLVAPVGLRQGIRALIEREMAHASAGRPSGIIIKNNALADPAVIRALYKASQAGVHIDLIVRGVCCLRPGIPGISERIRVRSIVGRFLEHSRIYYFANGGEPEVYIGSADLMERNLDRRIEVLCPVADPDLKTHLRDVVLAALVADNERAWELKTDGTYVRASAPPDAVPVNAQQLLLAHYTSADRP